MKKFCSKITKQQWRVTVPNINSSIFKRSVSREKDDLRISPRVKKSCSGCYDIEAAQQEFEQKTNVTNTIILENYSSDSESDGDYQDATAMSEKLSSTDELDTSVYADVELSPKSNRSSYINECCGDFEVPEISFSFFEERNHEYQDVKVQRKPELKNDKIEDEKTKPKEISEITIMLTEASPVLVKNREISKLSKSTNNLFDSSNPKPKLPKYDFTRSLNSFPNYPRIMKSGSDPNISHSRLELDEDDGVYKVPGAVRRYRQSHSLNDFNMENVDLASSASSSIEHISCSQTIVNKDSDYCASSSTAMDYCETRKKMPNKKRKISFLRKPKSTAWINLRSKLDDMMAEHASKQRVGAFANRDGAINIEEMYKSSKNKCKKMLKTTGKMFQKPKKEQENVDHSVEETAIPKIVPRTIKPSDIEVKLNIDNGNSDVGDNGSSGVSRTDKSDKVVIGAKPIMPTALVEEKLEDGEFHSLKNVFRRSKVAHETHSGFDDLRKYVKQGEDFCKELSSILQER
ncbi:hypothetical protein FQR65_LT05998 [Abscondita terminalis]|nr:hypothetical protein FQR65_LT05998 [Abscondita terminalis]